MIVLKSSDGETFEVEEAVALESQTIKHIIEVKGNSADTTMPLPNLTDKISAKVIEYCKRHVEAEASNSSDEDLKSFNSDFVKVDHQTLFDLILAAKYLNIKMPEEFLFPKALPDPRGRERSCVGSLSDKYLWCFVWVDNKALTVVNIWDTNGF